MVQLYSAALFFVLLFFSGKCASQKSFKYISYISGFGFGENTRTLYKPLYIASDFNFQIFKSGKTERTTFFTGYVEPQFNLVFTNRPIDYEFGVNCGLRNNIKVSTDLYLFQMLGSGPHFFSSYTTRQAQGFIFSDNIAMGVYKRIHKNKPTYLELRFLYRHLSNAGLKRPNSGINNFNILMGLIKVN